jgi:hypothetical protein
MPKTGTPAGVQDVTVQWMQITGAVAHGRLSPEDGVAKLQALADAYPKERDWLEEEIKTIRWQFALDVAEQVREHRGSYWDRLRMVIQALLEERLDHNRALLLLKIIDADHPEHAEHTARLIDGIAESPMRQSLDTDD